jgi:hypothetical protein
VKAVIYTALHGPYFADIPPAPRLGVPCIAYTDRPMRAPGWDVRVTIRPETAPRLRAKWFKLNPHHLFPQYDVSIWVDAGWQIVNPRFAVECAAYLGAAPAVFYPHRWRTTIRAEVAEYTTPKFDGVPVQAQAAAYLESGYPDDIPLLECTSLLRRHNDRRVVALDEAWWHECLDWTHADQLSLPYLLWKLGTPYSRFPFNLSEQPWIRLVNWRAD